MTAAYTREVWTAVRRLWPNLGADPAAVIEPYIPVLPAFLNQSHAERRTPEWAAQELTAFFLRIYVEQSLSPAERQTRLKDLLDLSQRSLEESQKVGVLPFTAAIVGAHQVASAWAAEGKLDPERVGFLQHEVVLALAGKPSRHISPIGRLLLGTSQG